jgi:hypothetical protein
VLQCVMMMCEAVVCGQPVMTRTFYFVIVVGDCCCICGVFPFCSAIIIYYYLEALVLGITILS